MTYEYLDKYCPNCGGELYYSYEDDIVYCDGCGDDFDEDELEEE